MATTYTISDLAREFEVTTRTIRHYEDEGLLNPARQGTARIFSTRDRVRLKLALRGKRLGFTLAGDQGALRPLRRLERRAPSARGVPRQARDAQGAARAAARGHRSDAERGRVFRDAVPQASEPAEPAERRQGCLSLRKRQRYVNAESLMTYRQRSISGWARRSTSCARRSRLRRRGDRAARRGDRPQQRVSARSLAAARPAGPARHHGRGGTGRRGHGLPRPRRRDGGDQPRARPRWDSPTARTPTCA